MENNTLPLLVAKVVTMKCGLRMRAKCKGLNIRHDLIKLLEENRGKTFCVINHINAFLDQSSKAKEIKAKINKWNLVKLTCLPEKETIKKMKRQCMEWEKIFANNAAKCLISKIYNSS